MSVKRFVWICIIDVHIIPLGKYESLGTIFKKLNEKITSVLLRKMKLVPACLSQKEAKHDSQLSTRSYPKLGENDWPNLVMNFTFPTEKMVKKNQVPPH